jgi:hypothetical protein
VRETLKRENEAETIWTASLDASGCQPPISLEIGKYRVWVEGNPNPFKDGASVYPIGRFVALMQGQNDPEDLATFDAYLGWK